LKSSPLRLSVQQPQTMAGAATPPTTASRLNRIARGRNVGTAGEEKRGNAKA
jgi:hypothetical protein